MDRRRYCGIIIDWNVLAGTKADGEHHDSGARLNTIIRFCGKKLIGYMRRGSFFRSCVSTMGRKNQEAWDLPYILVSNPHPFYSFRGLKSRMRIRIACGLDSQSRAGFWKNDRAAVRAVRTIQ